MTYCKLNACEKCPKFNDCGGCEKCDGMPFGGICVASKIIKEKGFNAFSEFKKGLINKINDMKIINLHIDDLNLLNGFYVNLEYPLPNGTTVKFLNDNDIYLGNQIEIPNSEKCYGVVANEEIILICRYGCMGKEPEIISYIKNGLL